MLPTPGGMLAVWEPGLRHGEHSQTLLESRRMTDPEDQVKARHTLERGSFSILPVLR